MRYLVTIFCISFLTACSSVPKQDISLNPAQNNVSEKSLLMSSEKQALKQINQFLAKNQTPTELQKIDFLLQRIKGSQARFFRNNQEYDGRVASKWLRWKMHHEQYADNPIDTAYRFVHEVADGSRNSGLPYQIIFVDGDYVKSEIVFQEELMLLENEIKKSNFESVIEDQAIENIGSFPNENFITPTILSAKN